MRKPPSGSSTVSTRCASNPGGWSNSWRKAVSAIVWRHAFRSRGSYRAALPVAPFSWNPPSDGPPRAPALVSSPSRLPLASSSAELVVSNLILHWFEDVTSILRETWRVLRPGGLIAFATFGPGTLEELRRSWRAVDGHAHVIDLMDMHDTGDAMMRAGFGDVVMDAERVTVTWPDARALLQDLRGLGTGNPHPARPPGLTTPRRLAVLVQALGRVSIGRPSAREHRAGVRTRLEAGGPCGGIARTSDRPPPLRRVRSGRARPRTRSNDDTLTPRPRTGSGWSASPVRADSDRVRVPGCDARRVQPAHLGLAGVEFAAHGLDPRTGPRWAARSRGEPNYWPGRNPGVFGCGCLVASVRVYNACPDQAVLRFLVQWLPAG